jgi:glycosyltransferase involved in cell wall biosynthesis
LFYTYWLGPITLGVGLAKYNNPKIKLISRAHRGDLYFEIDKLPPYQKLIVSLVDELFLISNHGKNYIQQLYPGYSSKYKVSKLGTPEQNIATNQSKDGIFRIVSCSYMVPVKRIDLLIEGLKELGLNKPNYSFEWNHIGYGPLESKLKEKSLTLPDNVSYSFLGFLDDNSFLSYYKNNPVDVFINVSSSEGIPVSIMEAQSFGIPVIATDVGGVSEIVSNSVGVLLSSNPAPTDIAQSICKFLDNPAFAKKARLSSKYNWSRNYDAEKNYMEFARRLEDI